MSQDVSASQTQAHSLSQMYSQGPHAPLLCAQDARAAPQHDVQTQRGSAPQTVLVQGPYGPHAVPATSLAMQQVRPRTKRVIVCCSNFQQCTTYTRVLVPECPVAGDVCLVQCVFRYRSLNLRYGTVLRRLILNQLDIIVG